MEAALSSPVDRHRLSYDDLLAPFYESFKPPERWRVGTEAEKFGLLDDTFEPLPYAGPRSVRAVLDALVARFGWTPNGEYEGGEIIALKRQQASITLEPGAQLELSGSPFASVHDTQAEWLEHLAELRAVGSSLGIAWLALGFHPFAHRSELPWVPKLRYSVMREYLPRRGGMGLDMMLRTCTVQANLDYASEEDALRKLRVAAALSPIITAMFANSPLFEGALGGERTRRALVWLDTDPDRTGLLPFLWSDQASLARYVDWALDVPMFMVKRDATIVRNTGQTFRSFMRDGFAGTYATADDWLIHLGTLFPEVRLKKTIELRGADCPPFELVAALPALSKGLLYQPAALQKAEALASTLPYDAVQGARIDIARRGLAAELAGRPLHEWASELVAIARGGLTLLHAQAPDARGDESCYLEPLERLLARRQSPADALLEKLDPARPLPPQVLQYCRL